MVLAPHPHILTPRCYNAISPCLLCALGKGEPHILTLQYAAPTTATAEGFIQAFTAVNLHTADGVCLTDNRRCLIDSRRGGRSCAMRRTITAQLQQLFGNLLGGGV